MLRCVQCGSLAEKKLSSYGVCKKCNNFSIESREVSGVGKISLLRINGRLFFPDSQKVCRSCGELTELMCQDDGKISMPCCLKCYIEGLIDEKIAELKKSI